MKISVAIECTADEAHQLIGALLKLHRTPYANLGVTGSTPRVTAAGLDPSDVVRLLAPHAAGEEEEDEFAVDPDDLVRGTSSYNVRGFGGGLGYGYGDEVPNAHLEKTANNEREHPSHRNLARAILARRARDREAYIKASRHAQPPHDTPVYRDGDRLVAVDGDLRQGFSDGVSDEDLADLARNGYWVGRAAQAVLEYRRRHRVREEEAA